jgi:hypothetical protein
VPGAAIDSNVGSPEYTQAKLTMQTELFAALSRKVRVTVDAGLADLVHFVPRKDQPFQRWFRYREGYSPEFVERVISQQTDTPQLVVDPFCGSGTTLLAARLAGVGAVGLDINPVSALVARAKTRRYGSAAIRRLRSLTEELTALRPGMESAPVPALRIIGKIFRPDVLDALLVARHRIDSESDPLIRDFLKVGWLAILEEVSNVFKEGNGIKYRNRKRTPTGYHTVPWEQLHHYQRDGYELVRERLSIQYALMLRDLEAVPVGEDYPVPAVHEGSALCLNDYVAENSSSLCIFSPPYCNNFNYMKIFKVELWTGGFVQSYEDLRRLNHRALRSHVETDVSTAESHVLPEEVQRVTDWIAAGELWSPRIPASVTSYFVDMRSALIKIHEAMVSGGECHIVVGNSAYGGVLVPTDLLLAEIARVLGFKVVGLTVARHLTTSSQQRAPLGALISGLRESVLALRKV